MFGPFRITNPLSGGLLWKIPWRLSRFQKRRHRLRLRAVDSVVATVDAALAKKGQTLEALERWKAEMPTEAEMLPRDKYTMFDRKAKKYRKGIHSKWPCRTFRICEGILTLGVQNCQSGRGFRRGSTRRGTERDDLGDCDACDTTTCIPRTMRERRAEDGVACTTPLLNVGIGRISGHARLLGQSHSVAGMAADCNNRPRRTHQQTHQDKYQTIIQPASRCIPREGIKAKPSPASNSNLPRRVSPLLVVVFHPL